MQSAQRVLPQTAIMLAFPVLIVLLACSGILGTPLEQMEDSYIDRLERFDELRTRATGNQSLQTELDQARANFESQYTALPSEEQPRIDALGPLNQAMNQRLDSLEEKVEKMEAGALAAAQAKGAKIRSRFNGTWVAPGYQITIHPRGHVQYKNNSGTIKKTIDAHIQSFTPQEFTVGYLGITTTFTIDEAPHQDGTTIDDANQAPWKMKLNGIEYTRQ